MAGPIGLDRKLNLTIEIDRPDGSIIHIHSTPVAPEIFDRYFMVIAQTYTALMERGSSFMVSSGPKVAFLLMKEIATQEGRWDGELGLARGFVAEVRRLTNVLMPTDDGWDMIPFEEAAKKHMVDAEQAAEVDGILAFFTVLSLMVRKAGRPTVLANSFTLWGGQITSSTCTEFRDSLPTSTETDNSGATPPVSPLPS